jgi:phosphoribosylanthranilate isomerase
MLKDIKLSQRVILSGGLTPENVSAAIKIVKPYGVDVSTGVEDSPGKKNHTKMRKFIEAVKNGV